MSASSAASARALCAAAIALLASACGGGGGSSGAGSGTTTVSTNTVPGAPVNVIATAGNGNASVAFAPPASNGGTPVINYAAACFAPGTSQTVSAATSPIIVTPLTNSVTYSCTVTATNAVGTGPASAASSVTPLASIGTPSAPALQSVTAANTSAVLAFQPPASAGVSPITGYTASCTFGTGTWSQRGTTSPILILGLTNGITYSCSVAAINAIGTGGASLPLNVTVNPSPATPAGVAEFTTVDFNAVVDYANPTLPAYYDQTVNGLDNIPAGTTIDNKIATLGRVLFYDKRLSINDAVACASCHQQARGFTDNNRFSAGFSGTAFTTAHAMRLGNVRYYQPGTMFWDKRAASVEAQASQPIQNSVEMGWDAAVGGITALIAKMDATIYYRDLFNWAFGSPTITEARMQTAIAQFERSMIAVGSRWDAGYATVFDAAAPNRGLNLDLPNFTVVENRGRQVFMTPPNQGGGGCSACHRPPTFALDGNSGSNGLDAGETRLFKSASLKSIAVTGPYMHDGRFASLDTVIDFYDHGVQVGPALDNRLRQGPGALQLNLSPGDKAALVVFLRTLDDTSLNTDARFSSPIVK